MQRQPRGLPALRAGLLVAFVFLAPPCLSETLYVSDQFEVPLRTGMTTEHAILRMLSSGTAVEMLEVNKEQGYTRVRTQSGVEGYMLSRYLLTEAPARDQLAALRQRLASAGDEQGGLSRPVDELGQQRTTAQQTMDGPTTERDQKGAD